MSIACVLHFIRLPVSLIESPNTTRLLMHVGQGGSAGEGGSLRASGGGDDLARRRGGGDLAFLCGFFFASAIVEQEAARIATRRRLRSDILCSRSIMVED